MRQNRRKKKERRSPGFSPHFLLKGIASLFEKLIIARPKAPPLGVPLPLGIPYGNGSRELLPDRPISLYLKNTIYLPNGLTHEIKNSLFEDIKKGRYNGIFKILS